MTENNKKKSSKKNCIDFNILSVIDEWTAICLRYSNNNKFPHFCDNECSFYKIWSGVVQTKYLNEWLLGKIIEILPALTKEHQHYFFEYLSSNPALTIDMILSYPEFPWNLAKLSRHINVHDILSHSELKWKWDRVSDNLSVTMDVILANMNKPWEWKQLSCHPNLTMSDIESHVELPWNWAHVNRNPNISLSMFEATPEWCCNWIGFNCCCKLTVDLLRHDTKRKWDFISLSRYNSSITLDLLLATRDLPWNFRELSWNPCLTMDMLLAFPDENWNWRAVSGSNGITMFDVESHMDLPWEWRDFLYRFSIRIFEIETHWDKPWALDMVTNSVFNPDEYIEEMCCKYSVLGMHDEDYGRGKECLNYENVLDLVLQDEYCICEILVYI